MNNQSWKGKKNKSGQISVWCCGSVVGAGICGAAALIRDWNYGIEPVGSYGDVGDRVCGQHQKILKLMSCLDF